MLRRAATLFAVGIGLSLFAGLFPDLDVAQLADASALGILQRIAVAYAVGAMVLLAGYPPPRLAVALMAGYTLVMFAGAGTWSGAIAFARDTNAATRLDGILLGRHGSGAHTVLSIIPAAATVLLGASMAQRSVVAGTLRASWRITLTYGVLPVAAGLVLSPVIPITRYLWSPSFALITAGLTGLALVILPGALGPAAGGRWLAPVAAVGANPLLLFVLSELGRIVLSSFGTTDAGGQWCSFWQAGFDALAQRFAPTAASAVFSVLYVLVFVGLAVVLARRKIYVKL